MAQTLAQIDAQIDELRSALTAASDVTFKGRREVKRSVNEILSMITFLEGQRSVLAGDIAIRRITVIQNDEI